MDEEDLRVAEIGTRAAMFEVIENSGEPLWFTSGQQ